MRRLIIIAALSALVFAKPNPESYKETEDFQYSRSSSDDGTKSGFYGAQRGNMGGNYERAHNMDTLAQHQMSGLVRQVDGELGEGGKTRTGSVYTAANSRGIYGSGNYDLTNLEGRNFAEGESFGNSQSHSSLSSQNSRYRGQSYSGMEHNSGISSSHSQDARYSGYQSSRHTDQRQIDNLQAVDTSQGLGRYETNNQAGYNTQYYKQFGSHGRSELDQSSANLHSSSGYDGNLRAHYITTPVKVVMRPGGRVAIPIAVPTYAVSQNVLSENNGINSDAEIFNQQGGSSPTNKVKHYESSYSYRKQWEKHHAIPGDVSIAASTENPFPKNSELYEDAQLLQSSKNQFQNANSQTVHSGDLRSYSKSSSNRSRFQAGYNTQESNYDSQQSQSASQQRQSGSQQSQSGLHSSQSALNTQDHSGFDSQHNSAFSGTAANAYRQSGMAADLTNAAGDLNSKPKSYHSSYSYHKSWERQGDPYVIEPVGGAYDGQASERLTAASSNSAAYSSRQYGSHSRQAHQSYTADCDDQSHVRVARSYNTDQKLEQGENQWEDLGQQTQSKFENLEDLGQQQQNKWDNLQDLGQQTQNQWDNLQQLGQETQNQWDNLQQLGQQTQNQWDNLQQLGQQTQDKWNNLEDLGQQQHRDLEQHQNENLEDFSQQSQNEDMLTNFEQQASNQKENLDVLNQHIQKESSLTNFEQQANGQNDNLEQFSQHTQKEDVLPNFEQQTSNQNENLDIFNQQNHNTFDNFEKQNDGHNDMLHNYNNFGQVTGFEPQTNADYLNQNIQKDRNLFGENFMGPNTEWTGNGDKNSQHEVEKSILENDRQNLFSLPSSSVETNKGWLQNTEQHTWNTYYNQNTNFEHKHHFWHTNNFNNEFKNSFPSSSQSTNDNGHPLQSLWDKINNIAGEIMVTESNTDDEKLNSYDYSNFYLHNQSFNDIQNSQSWAHMPFNPNGDSVDTNINKESKDKKNQHSLFDEQIQNTTTAVLPTLLPHHSQPSVENVNISLNNPDQETIYVNKNSQDEGRGDIGPEEIPLEITKTDKPYKTPQEIEILSLTKESQTPKESDVLVPPVSVSNKEENTRNELLLTHTRQQNKTNQNKPNNYEPSYITTTIPTVQITTTVNSNTNIHNVQPVHALNLNSISSTDLEKQIPHLQTVDNVETTEDVQQINLEQQYEDFGQQQNTWHATNDWQQENDQQNTDQQFEDLHPQQITLDQKSLLDFGQVPSSLTSPRDINNKEVKPGNPSQNYNTVGLSNVNNREQNSQDTVNHNPQIMESIQVSPVTEVTYKKQNSLDSQKPVDVISRDNPVLVETIAEKPGFWKKIGNKFTSAKDKVISWFSSS